MNQMQTPQPGLRRDMPGSGSGSASEFQAQIGMQLRAVYETMISEPVPDRFMKLLEELDRRKADRKPDEA